MSEHKQVTGVITLLVEEITGVLTPQNQDDKSKITIFCIEDTSSSLWSDRKKPVDPSRFTRWHWKIPPFWDMHLQMVVFFPCHVLVLRGMVIPEYLWQFRDDWGPSHFSPTELKCFIQTSTFPDTQSMKYLPTWMVNFYGKCKKI